jgi:hypothetical protein
MEGRLNSMQKRVKALTEAINAVRPALEAFYGSLTDAQKEHSSFSRCLKLQKTAE